MISLEDDYEQIPYDQAQVGDIFYSGVLFGGIGHAMIYLGQNEDGEKMFDSYFKLSDHMTGTRNELMEFQPINNMVKTNTRVYRKKK